MKRIIKSFIQSKAPKLLNLYRILKNRNKCRKAFKGLHKKVRKALYGGSQIKVLSGPFNGLKYFDKVVWGPITPKWLGSYESELHPTIEKIVASGYKRIIDIGCAEGYYAVGLPYRIQDVEVFAFDTDFISRNQTRKLARINAVDKRVNVNGYCDWNDISRLSNDHTLIICDIEGSERSFLDPDSCETLRHVDILVEIHEFPDQINAMNLIKNRFNDSHLIEIIDVKDRIDWINSNPLLQDKELLTEAVDENRTASKCWYWMKSKKS